MQFDLKNAVVKIKDGYAGTGTTVWRVNNMTGYMAGAVTMVVDGGTGIVVIGDTFTVAGDTGVTHQVTAKVDTLGNTTSITFTPALAMAVVDNAIITFLPHAITMKIGEGNCQYTEKKDRKYTLDRGKIGEVRNADESPVEVKIDAIWEFITATSGSGIPTIEDVFKKRGEAATWVSSETSNPCAPYSVDIEITLTPPCTNEQKEIITLPFFRYEQLEHNMKDGMFAISGKCNVVEATAVRTT